MFLDFLYQLRAQGLPVSSHEWLDFMKALEHGMEGGSLNGFYHLGRAVLIKSEGHYDAYDVAFALYFEGCGLPAKLGRELLDWLNTPEGEQGELPPPLLEADELLKQFKRLLEAQKERHDGGNRWIGARGTSPFGNQGKNPQGMRIGGESGARSAVYLAESRQFHNYRSDVTLNVRQFKVALKGLRRLEKAGRPELKLPDTIRRSADNGGDIELVFGPARKNSVRLLLLMDAGGSMEPYAELVNRLFSAAFDARHFRDFKYYYFHNCVYARVYEDIAQRESAWTREILRDLSPDYRVVLVGDASMAPWELNADYEILVSRGRTVSGLDWLTRIRNHFQDAVWLNPEPDRYWDQPTVNQIRALFPMYPLTLDGLNRAIRRLRRGRRDLL